MFITAINLIQGKVYNKTAPCEINKPAAVKYIREIYGYRESV
jgi:hypothetical protein